VKHALVTQLIGVLVSALLFAACGGDDEGTASRPHRNGIAADAGTRAGGSPKPGTDRKREDDGRGRGARHDGAPAIKRPPKSRREALRRLPARLRAKIVRHYTRVVLDAFDLRSSTISVSFGGVEVDVTLSRRTACRARPDEAERILRALRRVVPYPRSVTIAVTGTNEPFATYLSRCAAEAPPGGRGRIVFRKSGSRLHQSHPFRIASKRWSIEYSTTGTFFQVYVLKGKRAQRDPISSRRAGSGRKTFSNGPGKFKLYISGSRDWTVRVRESG
jgi:hypothetical protein